MSDAIHFFTARGAPCGVSDASRWSVVAESVTCAGCAESLRTREHEEHRRRVRGRRVLARLRARGRA